MASDRTVARLQWSVMNQQERLEAFRADYPNKSLTVAGVEWQYRICGAGARTLLLLPGGELVNDMGFDLVAALAPRFRIIYPAYPRVTSLDSLADGVAAILDRENIARVCVLGASFGGAVAQSMIRRHPERIERLVLSNTGVPTGIPGARPEDRQCGAIVDSVAAAARSSRQEHHQVVGRAGRRTSVLARLWEGVICRTSD
jgi:pimeloyl-ACP methyl ester carboxylesterase